MPVYVTSTNRVAVNSARSIKVTNAATNALLTSIANQNFTPSNTLISRGSVHQLVLQGVIPNLPQGERATSSMARSSATECQPGDVDTSPATALNCSPDLSKPWVVQLPELTNANKGEIIGVVGNGDIGTMLASIGQYIQHTGFMTENRTRIRHNTASEDRVQGPYTQSFLGMHVGSHLVGLNLVEHTVHIDPNVLTWGAPGSGVDSMSGKRSRATTSLTTMATRTPFRPSR